MEPVPRLIGLDVGTKTIGLAVSDPLGLTAQGLGVIRRQGIGKDLEALQHWVALYNPERFVVGYPLNMNGSPGPQAQFVEDFTEQLRSLGVPVEFVDERLTTKQAEHAMIAGGVRRDKRKLLIDQQAAILILQGYLDRRHRTIPPPSSPS